MERCNDKDCKHYGKRLVEMRKGTDQVTHVCEGSVEHMLGKGYRRASVFIAVFQGIPLGVFYSEEALDKYFQNDGSSLLEIRRNQANDIGKWEVHEVKVHETQ